MSDEDLIAHIHKYNDKLQELEKEKSRLKELLAQYINELDKSLDEVVYQLAQNRGMVR